MVLVIDLSIMLANMSAGGSSFMEIYENTEKGKKENYTRSCETAYLWCYILYKVSKYDESWEVPLTSIGIVMYATTVSLRVLTFITIQMLFFVSHVVCSCSVPKVSQTTICCFAPYLIRHVYYVGHSELTGNN